MNKKRALMIKFKVKRKIVQNKKNTMVNMIPITMMRKKNMMKKEKKIMNKNITKKNRKNKIKMKLI